MKPGTKKQKKYSPHCSICGKQYDVEIDESVMNLICDLQGWTKEYFLQVRFAKPICKQCVADENERKKITIIESKIYDFQNRIGDDLKNAELNNFELWNQTSNELFQIANDFIKDFLSWNQNRKRILILSGNTGIGKSHIAVSIIKELIRYRVQQSMFVVYSDFIRDYMASELNMKANIISKIKLAHYLILDDLNVQNRDIKFEQQILQSLIYNIHGNHTKAMIITTNMEREKLLRFISEQTEQTEDRIRAIGEIYAVQGESFRTRNIIKES
ncbi:ATP-binding protein [candidate division KSB1 bacterium]|nr:ATP-binding protein [candidate division KSB1 bacterium]